MFEIISSYKNSTGERANDRRAFLALLQAHQIQLTQSLGQNFLYDQALLDELARLAGVQEHDVVVEVGSGAGSLTASLAERAAQGLVISCEIDLHLEPLLRTRFADHKNVRFVFENALKLNFTELAAQHVRTERRLQTKDLRVAANLPYYITTELICKLILELPHARSMAFMVQLEATERILAVPGKSKSYGPMAVLVQTFGSVKIALRIPRHAFIPEPHVDSALLVLDKIDPEPGDVRARILEHFPAFSRFVQAAFCQRRKTLLNNLKVYGAEACLVFENKLAELGLPKNVRAEALAWHDLGELFLLTF